MVHTPRTAVIGAGSSGMVALKALVEFGTVVYFENSMTPAQRELAYLTASVTNDCHY